MQEYNIYKGINGGATQTHYIYRHIRLDTNEPFYIGIGQAVMKAKTYKAYYTRAYNTKKRSEFWKNIISKTDYIVEILFETEDREKAIEKEIEFIALYGRLDLKKGTIVNHTDGGEGSNGFKHSEKSKSKMKSRVIGGKEVINTLTGEIFPTAKKASEHAGYKYGTFRSYVKGLIWNRTEYMYLEDYKKGLKINENTKAPLPLDMQEKYINLENGRLYITIKDIQKDFPYSDAYICNMMYNKRLNKINVVPIKNIK